MGQPTSGDVHVDEALTDFSIAYIQLATNFVAGKALAVKPVDKKSDKYFVFNKDDWNRDDSVKKRAPGERAPRSGFRLSTQSYDADAWWTECPLSDMVQVNADQGLALDVACTKLVTQRCLIRRERQFVSTFMVGSVWGTTVTGGTDFTKWDDYSSDPQKDIDTGKKAVWENTSFVPNKFIVSYPIHQALKRHPAIKDMIKYTSSESVTAEIIAKYLEVDEYLVMYAIYNTALEGLAGSYTGINMTSALLLYNDGDPSLMSPCAGALFAWTGLTAFNESGVAIEQYYDVTTKDDVVRGQFAHDMEITGSALGYYYATAVS